MSRLLLTLIGILLPIPVVLAAAAPRFADYGSGPIYRGPTRFPDFRGRDRDFSDFRTRIRNGMKEGPNFAAKLTMIEVGCGGGGCRFVFIGDVTTGRVYSFPLGGEDNLYLDLHYHPQSRLVIALWQADDRCLRESFVWTGTGFDRFGRTELGPAEVCDSAGRQLSLSTQHVSRTDSSDQAVRTDVNSYGAIAPPQPVNILLDLHHADDCWSVSVETREKLAVLGQETLYRVHIKNWSLDCSAMTKQRKKRTFDGDGKVYVLCSKTRPTLIEPHDKAFLAKGLVPNQETGYEGYIENDHYLYLASCHGLKVTDYREAIRHSARLGYRLPEIGTRDEKLERVEDVLRRRR